MAVQCYHNNGLVLNGNKTYQLIMGRQKQHTGRLPDLEEITITKYLGVTLECNHGYHT